MIRVKKGLHRPLGLNLSIALVIAVILSAFYWSGTMRRIENDFSDLIIRTFTNTDEAGSQVVFALTSQQCLDDGVKYYDMGWPWKRAIYGKLIRFLNLSGARLIVFDSIFSEKSVSNSPGVNDDKQFARSIREAGNVIIGFHFTSSEKGSKKVSEAKKQKILLDKDFNLPLQSTDQNTPFEKTNIVLLPIDPLVHSVASVGTLSRSIDLDGTIRRTSLIVNYLDKYYPSLALATILQHHHVDEIRFEKNSLHLDDQAIPLDENGLLRLKYYGDNNVYKDYYHMEMIRLYDHINALYQIYSKLVDVPPIAYPDLFKDHKLIKKMGKVLKENYPDLVKKLPKHIINLPQRIIDRNPPEAFHDKIILMGSSAPGLGDHHSTPFSPQEYGFHVHATAIDNLLQNDLLMEYRENLYIVLIIIFLGLVTAYLVTVLPFFWGIISSGLLFLLVLVSSVLLYVMNNVIMSSFTMANGVLFTFFSVKVVNYFWELRERKEILESLVIERTIELQESEERYRQLVELSPEAILVHDKDRIAFVNQCGTEILGAESPEKLIGQSLYEFIHLDSIDDLKKWLKELDNLTDVLLVEKTLKRLDGVDIEVEMSSISFLYEDKRMTLTISRDITERKQLERLREDMERIVRHDLRGPIQNILGFSEILLNSIEDEKRKKYASIIHESGNEMLHMVNKSLDLFKMEEGSYQLQREAFDLVQVFSELNQSFSHLLELKLIEIIFEVGGRRAFLDHVYTIIGERIYLKSMFANLIQNAIEASPNDRNITISLHEEKDFHKIMIHNFGAIPKAIESRFFERYVSSGKVGGTGLGSYSSLLIAKSHGGNITFSTSEAEGTFLYVTLANQVI